MKYYRVHPEDKHDTKGYVLNTKAPFQIDFHHFSREKKRIVIVEDCTSLRGENHLPEYIFKDSWLHPMSKMIWSAKAYECLLPLIKSSIEHIIHLHFDELSFFFVLPYKYIPQIQTTEEGFRYMPSLQEVYDKLLPNIHFFEVPALRGLFASETVKEYVEENKLKGFHFQYVDEVNT